MALFEAFCASPGFVYAVDNVLLQNEGCACRSIEAFGPRDSEFRAGARPAVFCAFGQHIWVDSEPRIAGSGIMRARPDASGQGCGPIVDCRYSRLFRHIVLGVSGAVVFNIARQMLDSESAAKLEIIY